MHDHITDEELVVIVKRLERFADLSDARFRIPGTNIRFGLDSLIGLVPVVGEVVGLGLAFYLILEAHKLGAPFSLKLKMFRNALFDLLLGLIPIIGDIADVAFKANVLNVRLLAEYISNETAKRHQLQLPQRNAKNRYWLIIALLFLAATAVLATMLLI